MSGYNCQEDLNRMLITHQNFWIFAAPFLSILTALAKLVRVKLLLVALLADGYAEFVFFLFLNGFIISFEPAHIKIFVKSITNNGFATTNLRSFKKLSNHFNLLITFVGVIVLTVVSPSENFDKHNYLASIVFLILANHCYSRIVIYLSVLEGKGLIQYNRI